VERNEFLVYASLGLSLGLAYVSRKGLLYSISLHALNNLIGFLMCKVPGKWIKAKSTLDTRRNRAVCFPLFCLGIYKTITTVSIFARGILLLALLVATVFHIFIKMMW